MAEFLRVVKMTPEEKKLKVPDRMTREEFQKQLKLTSEDISSSSSGLYIIQFGKPLQVGGAVEIFSSRVKIQILQKGIFLFYST